MPTITITQQMIDDYAAISGDFNPVHVDPVFAAATPFGQTIAHGCIPIEPVFQLVRELTGRPVMPEGSRMKLRYRRPAHPGDTISVRAAELVDGWCDFVCLNQRGDVVIEGEVRLTA
jgi:acyl dehydratase